ncbi:hypothetical protein ACHAPT_010945 [Fusarium lateritium]
MRALLQTALANYQDLDLEVANWTFSPPFMPIVHRWDKLCSLCEDSATEEATELIEFLRPILAPQVDSLANTRKTGTIKFGDLWQIFAPHEFAVTGFYDVEAVCRVAKYELVEPPDPMNPPYWTVELEYLDWNGHRCGYATTTVVINWFAGYRRVALLPAYPLSFHSDAPGMRQQITARGRVFESLRGYHFRACSGTKVAGRVIIDAFAYYLTNDIVKPNLVPLGLDKNKIVKCKAKKEKDEGGDEEDKGDEEDESEDECQTLALMDDCWDPPPKTKTSQRDAQQGKKASAEPKDTPAEGNTEMTATTSNFSLKRPDKLEPLTDDQCLLANPWMKGYDLKTKEWAQFFVDDLSPVIWNDEAFGNLVLPGGEKQLAWEFVENKALASNFDDFIQDKGRGLIILMFGPPDVGKTYTAEAVAEQAHVPLYSMSAGELGTVPKDVEAALNRALTLCGLWDAMLLLDEADVFLSARTDSDLARNELVAVFLNKLEYYTGENFINRTGCDRSNTSSEDVDKLAEIHLNGREIKNLIKSAHLLSLKSGGVLKAERLFQLAQNRMMALGQWK